MLFLVGDRSRGEGLATDNRLGTAENFAEGGITRRGVAFVGFFGRIGRFVARGGSRTVCQPLFSSMPGDV